MTAYEELRKYETIGGGCEVALPIGMIGSMYVSEEVVNTYPAGENCDTLHEAIVELKAAGKYSGCNLPPLAALPYVLGKIPAPNFVVEPVAHKDTYVPVPRIDKGTQFGEDACGRKCERDFWPETFVTAPDEADRFSTGKSHCVETGARAYGAWRLV